jgi:hypothetical protein
MHNLLILSDHLLNFVQEPFLSEFVRAYWKKIALVLPIVPVADFHQSSYFNVTNMGHTVDWLFAIVPDLNHPLNVDWIFLQPRQAHPWGYGNHPATSNFNGGGSTSCHMDTLGVIETLAKTDRVDKWCYALPDLYSENPPKTFEFLYSFNLFRNAQCLESLSSPSIDELHDEPRELSRSICLGLYGCSDATLNMQWKVESMRGKGDWTAATTDLADKVTLAMRLSGKSDEVINVPPSEAFEQWMGERDDNFREPLLIRFKDDVLFCEPQVADRHCCDAYFLDCEHQKLQRLGGNGGSPVQTLKTWGLNPNADKFKFLFI